MRAKILINTIILLINQTVPKITLKMSLRIYNKFLDKIKKRFKDMIKFIQFRLPQPQVLVTI